MVVQESAPAKIILFGEHAVVYKQPALAVPVSSLRARVSIAPSQHGFHMVVYDQNNQPIPIPANNPLLTMAQMTFDALGLDTLNIQLQLHSDIPIASGLGSGAAISAAMIRAISAYANQSLTIEKLNEMVYETERIHHGTPSGIDNTVIVYERPVYFVRGNPIETIENAVPLHILIGDTGISAPTKEAIADVRRIYDAQPNTIPAIVETIGDITQQARDAMKQADIQQLGQLMVENHAHLKTLTVSSPELDALVHTALEAGAIGAKLSGGGRGGNMIALVTEKTQNSVRQALLNAGARQVISTIVEATI